MRGSAPPVGIGGAASTTPAVSASQPAEESAREAAHHGGVGCRSVEGSTQRTRGSARRRAAPARSAAHAPLCPARRAGRAGGAMPKIPGASGPSTTRAPAERSSSPASPTAASARRRCAARPRVPRPHWCGWRKAAATSGRRSPPVRRRPPASRKLAAQASPGGRQAEAAGRSTRMGSAAMRAGGARRSGAPVDTLDELAKRGAGRVGHPLRFGEGLAHEALPHQLLRHTRRNSCTCSSTRVRSAADRRPLASHGNSSQDSSWSEVSRGRWDRHQMPSCGARAHAGAKHLVGRRAAAAASAASRARETVASSPCSPGNP